MSLITSTRTISEKHTDTLDVSYTYEIKNCPNDWNGDLFEAEEFRYFNLESLTRTGGTPKTYSIPLSGQGKIQDIKNYQYFFYTSRSTLNLDFASTINKNSILATHSYRLKSNMFFLTSSDSAETGEQDHSLDAGDVWYTMSSNDRVNGNLQWPENYLINRTTRSGENYYIKPVTDGKTINSWHSVTNSEEDNHLSYYISVLYSEATSEQDIYFVWNFKTINEA